MTGGGNDGKTGTQILGGAGGFITNQNSSVTNIYLAKVSGYSSSNFMQFYVNGTLAGSITTTGTTVAYNITSDYRLKENVKPMLGALDTISKLKPVTYNWKADGSNGQGFIAHELQEVCPDAVNGKKDAVETYKDEDGNEKTRISPQGIDTSFLVATLTAAIQELKAEFDAYKATHP